MNRTRRGQCSFPAYWAIGAGAGRGASDRYGYPFAGVSAEATVPTALRKPGSCRFASLFARRT